MVWRAQLVVFGIMLNLPNHSACVEEGGQPIAVAINNRTLANDSLNGVYYPPVIWDAPTPVELARLRDEPIPPETGLPSIVTVVTQSQSCRTPLTQYGIDGAIYSLSYAKPDF